MSKTRTQPEDLIVRPLKLRIPDEEPEETLDPDLVNLNPLLPRPTFRLMLNGPSGSGKSNLFKWLLIKKYANIFTKIYVFCPTFFNDFTLNDLVKYEINHYYNDETDELIQKREQSPLSPLDETDIITESEPAQVCRIFSEKWKECEKAFRKDKFHKSLFVLDDLSIEMRNSTEIKNYFTKGRKCGISLIVMSNQYKTYEPTIRNQCTHYAFFKPATQAEADIMIADHGGMYDKMQMRNLFKSAFKKQGDFLFIDKSMPEDKRFRRGLGEFIVP